ncbi:MAG: ABC transporter ATP-binding protein, partial [Bacteroidetes bacterium]
SGGTRQKANLVLALMYDNPLLILDEPTAGLDPVAIIRLKDLLAEEVARGKIVLITTHIMSLVEELADEVIFLLDGRIHFRGSLEELRSCYGETSVERAIARLLEGNHSRFSQNGVPPKVPAVK